LRDRVVKRIEAEERITDGFIIPVTTAKEKPQQDEVVAVAQPFGPFANNPGG